VRGKARGLRDGYRELRSVTTPPLLNAPSHSSESFWLAISQGCPSAIYR